MFCTLFSELSNAEFDNSLVGLWHPTLFLILHLYIWEQIFAFSWSSSNFLPNKLINITAKQACKC